MVRTILHRRSFDKSANHPVEGWETFLWSVIERIRETAGSVNFIDATFPGHLLHHAVDCPIIAHQAGSMNELRFYNQFRASRGADPVRELTDVIGILPPTARPTWLFVDRLEMLADAFPALIQGNTRVLTFLDAREFRRTCDETPELSGWDFVQFILPDGTPTGFFAMMPLAGRDADPLFSSAVSAPPKYDWLRWRSRGAPKEYRLVRTGEFIGSSMFPRRYSARQLTTDNVYCSEGDEINSWIWTGPSPISRFALGRLPSRAKSVKVRFAANSLHQGLDEALLFQVNGVRCQHAASFNSNGSGVASLEVDASTRDAFILGIACRNSHSVESSERTIRVSIESIEIAI
ncbi:MAG: hypothetical protein J0H01_05560 [Rhizobiales bacterium]|nr:hypothetical protein [Hyphomicrobiales bacterium]